MHACFETGVCCDKVMWKLYIALDLRSATTVLILLLRLRSFGNQPSTSHQDIDSASTCSSKEQWLIAAALAPHHVRVVHDAGKCLQGLQMTQQQQAQFRAYAFGR